MASPILEVRGLSKEFDGLVAVDGLDLEVEEGTITGLIGPNGAGKTTTFDLITGVLKPDSGTVRFKGADITGMAPYEVPKLGLSRTFQEARIFADMTVWENMIVVPCPGDVEDEAERLLELVELEDERDSYGDELSGGQKVLLGIARSLMLQPDLIMLDEPFAGVNPGLVDDIAGLLFELKEAEDVTVFIISHEIEQVSNTCDEVIVMSNGKHLIKDVPAKVREDERVIQSYLGGAV